MISDTLLPLLSLRGSCAAVAIPAPQAVFARGTSPEAIWCGEIATPSARNDKTDIGGSGYGKKPHTIVGGIQATGSLT